MLWKPPSRTKARSWGVAGKGGKPEGRRAVQVVRPRPEGAASCRQRRQAPAKPGFARRKAAPTRSVLREDAHAAELGAAAAAEVVTVEGLELLERLQQRALQQAGRLVVVGLRAVGRFGDDRVHHAELETVPRVGLERSRRLLRLAA